MYYEEAVVDGVLCYRTKPDGEWIEVSKEKLSRDYMRLKAEIKRKDKLLKYIGNMSGDEMIGETDILERIARRALNEVK